MFKKLRIFIVLVLFFSFTMLNTLQALASSDTTPPTVKSIKIDKTAVEPGDNINIEVEAEDLESGISNTRTNRVVQVQKQNGDTYQYVYLNYDSTTKKYTGTYTVPTNSINGVWYISWIYFVDNVGNKTSIRPSEGSGFYQSFVVSNGSNDTTPPTVKSIKIDKTAVEPGDNINIEVEAEDLESGISNTRTNRVVQVQKQNGDTYQYVYLNYDSTTKKYTGTYTVPTNSINGVWYISWIYFVDNVGNKTSIRPSEGSGFYQSFVVSNGSNDTTPPTVKSIKIDKTAVEPGDNINIEVEAEDLESGISNTRTNRVVQVQKQNGDTYQYVYLNYDSTTKKYTGTYTVPTNSINGVWYISWIYFVDNVGNKTSIRPSEGSGFYQSFRVTNDLIPPNVPSVNEVSDKSTNVTGTAEAGSTITVMASTSVIGTGVTNSDGTFSVPIDVQKAGTTLTVTAKDDAGNISEAKEVTVKDVTAPIAPTVNEVTENSTNISGTAEAGSTITVKAGTAVIGTATVDTEDKYTVTIEKQKAGTKLSVTASDDAGNVSEMKEVTVKDVTAPVIPTVNEVTENSTNISGTAEAGSTITVKAGTEVIGTAIVDTEDKYTVTIEKQKAGTKLSVTASDDAGNVSEMKEVTVKDVTAPVIPTVNEVTENSTNISGTAEAGSTITVKAGTAVIGTATADTEGKYTVTIEKQKAGTKLTVTASDDAGNISEAKEVTVKDVTAPIAPTVNEVTENSTNISGTAEAGSTITVKAGTTVLGTATVDTEDKYTVTIEKQKAGTKLTVTVSDDAGNVSEVKEVTVKDVTAPSVPTVNVVYDNATVISGKAESNAKVYAMVGSKKIGEATAKNGAYTIKIAKQKAGTSISVYATDTSGNKSGSKTVKVIDKTPPSTPTVNNVYDNATVISGKAESNAKVYAMVGSKKIGEATAKNGAYTIKIAKQKAGTSISVYAIDTSGNKSGSKTVKVIDKTPPSTPTVNNVYDNATVISGKVETNAKVYAMVGSKKIGEVTAKNGAYTIKIAKQKAGTSISVYATDTSGNKSGSKTVKVIDKTPPSTPTVNNITSKTVTVTGKGEKGASIYIYNGSKKIGQGIVDSRGYFKAKIKAQKKGSSLKVYAQDKSGNKSKSKTVKVS
ncbi:Ig-like domain-containing protein [Peribacillus sp. ACCC06369]|uniref:Ig-like domain-containing protein n=1 Tax=Peribacillus sp. ACCC06369 TaxID=3055860 RepID=UPI0025A292CB|nr:Ig-like domain-containing protein [Peribacillus sp. ACCC06369]MDM5358805.1 Ig-like domain-containing protein [Peribacillus sp. ACCC06369]